MYILLLIEYDRFLTAELFDVFWQVLQFYEYDLMRQSTVRRGDFKSLFDYLLSIYGLRFAFSKDTQSDESLRLVTLA